MKIYIISEFKKDNFTAKMDKFTKRAVKLGIEFGYTLESTSESFYVIRNGQACINPNNVNPSDKKVYFTQYHFSVYGESPVINGYSFLAKIESSENGNLIHSHNNDYDFTSYRNANLTCEHCNVNRFRNFYYLVVNSETREVKMVGGNCLAQYISQPNAESIAEFYNDVLGIDFQDNERELTESFSGGRGQLEIKDFLALAIVIIRENGYTSAKNEDYFTHRIATKTLVVNEYFNTQSDRIVTSEEDKQKAESILNHIQTELTNKTQLTDYEYNILTMINNKYMKLSHAGYIVSIVPLYNRMMENQVKSEINSNSTESQFIGKVGDKLENIDATVTKIHSFDSQYGLTFVYTFDYNNNVMVWFTKDLNINLGDKVTIAKGTIKEHSTYNGVNQTIMTRCKIK